MRARQRRVRGCVIQGAPRRRRSGSGLAPCTALPTSSSSRTERDRDGRKESGNGQTPQWHRHVPAPHRTGQATGPPACARHGRERGGRSPVRPLFAPRVCSVGPSLPAALRARRINCARQPHATPCVLCCAVLCSAVRYSVLASQRRGDISPPNLTVRWTRQHQQQRRRIASADRQSRSLRAHTHVRCAQDEDGAGRGDSVPSARRLPPSEFRTPNNQKSRSPDRAETGHDQVRFTRSVPARS